jgi:hypothetical protein
MLAVALSIVAGGCRQALTVDDLDVVADALEPPPGWQQVDEERVGRCVDPVESCPRSVRVYDVPAQIDFTYSASAMLDQAGLALTDAVLGACRSEPDTGCSVRSQRDDVAVRATVTDRTEDGYTVSVRITEYVGP